LLPFGGQVCKSSKSLSRYNSTVSFRRAAASTRVSESPGNLNTWSLSTRFRRPCSAWFVIVSGCGASCTDVSDP
jgi:hypothetical protein